MLRNVTVPIGRQNIIEQRMDRNKPTIHVPDSLYQSSESSINCPVFGKAAGKMCVHDARTTFAKQSVLILFLECRVKGIDIGSFGSGKPVVHIGTIPVIVRHEWTHLERVDIAKNKVSDILDLFLAQIAPKQRAPFEMA
jgi:hypothetical protein